MALWPPDLIVEMSLTATEHGGRKTSIEADWYGCPVDVGGRYFDARFDLSAAGPIAPGTTTVAPLKFLDSEVVRHVVIGQELTLWEGRVIGKATVTEVCSPNPSFQRTASPPLN